MPGGLGQARALFSSHLARPAMPEFYRGQRDPFRPGRKEASARVLPHHEHVHVPERLGVIDLEAVPLIEVDLVGCGRKLLAEFFQHRRIVERLEA